MQNKEEKKTLALFFTIFFKKQVMKDKYEFVFVQVIIDAAIYFFTLFFSLSDLDQFACIAVYFGWFLIGAVSGKP